MDATGSGSWLDELEADWRLWLLTLFPDYFANRRGDIIPFGEHHCQLWDWVWSIVPGVRPRPFVAIWPRGGGKSTSAELACVALGARNIRRYGLYICETQDQADDHVSNIASLLESQALEDFYPDLGARMVGKFGNSRGWRRNRLRTASGFTIDALGLDSAARGVKLEDMRPDFEIIDDVDDSHDSAAVTTRKARTLTHKLLPAGSTDLAALAIQNLVQPNSIFSQLADGRADFLADRAVSGPFPAIQGLAYKRADDGRYVLTDGKPTWGGQDMARCQEMVDDMGISAFLNECQNEVEAPPGGMFSHLEYRHCKWEEVPPLVRIVVAVDPAVTNTDQSDSHGIQADGVTASGELYRLWSWEARTNPEDVLRRAIRKAKELGAQCVIVETDQGGDTWEVSYRAAWKAEYGELAPVTIPFRSRKAGSMHASKAERAGQMLVSYEHGKVIHVIGTHQTLERALNRFPLTKPYDLVDGAYWSWYELIGQRQHESYSW